MIFSSFKHHLTLRRLFVVLALLLTIVVTSNLANHWTFPDTGWPLGKGEKFVLNNQGATQKFTSRRDGLSGINVLFGGSRIDGRATLAFTLFEEDCQTEIFASKVTVTELTADNTVDFSFPRIDASRDKTFCFHLASNKKVATFVMDHASADSGLLSINGEDRPQSQSIPFRPTYRNQSLTADFEQLTQRISQYKPWFLKDFWLGTIASLSLLFSFLLLGLVILL